jgi:three-Cys-motif partner protein
MPHKDDDRRLFRSEDLLSPADLTRDAAAARGAEEADRRAELDAARMWISRDDGLLVRGVKPHSAEKSWMVSRAIDTVSSAMAGKWFEVHYLELYSGPGRLLDESTGREQVGSPIQALEVRKPFDRYVFSDFADECIEALGMRVTRHPTGREAKVICGDAKQLQHLERAAGLLDRRALVIAYLDPARPQDLHWSTVNYLANEFRYIDLIINLPVNSLARAIHGPYCNGFRGQGAAGSFLNHPAPHELLQWTISHRFDMPATMAAIRDFYDEQLISLGFLKPAHRTVDFPAASPYYDVLYVSRHPTGVDLWDRTNPEPLPPATLFDGLANDER